MSLVKWPVSIGCITFLARARSQVKMLFLRCLGCRTIPGPPRSKEATVVKVPFPWACQAWMNRWWGQFARLNFIGPSKGYSNCVSGSAIGSTKWRSWTPVWKTRGWRDEWMNGCFEKKNYQRGPQTDYIFWDSLVWHENVVMGDKCSILRPLSSHSSQSSSQSRWETTGR